MLYERQTYPDNYVDASFLSALRGRSALPRRPSYGAAVRAAQPVAAQLSVAVAVAVAGCGLRAGRLAAAPLLAGSGALLCASALLRAAAAASAAQQQQRPAAPRAAAAAAAGLSLALSAREAAVLVSGCALLSPLVATLAATLSPDTVAFLCALCGVLHLALADYRPGAAAADGLPGSLSLGAALAAAALLASRLDSPFDAFALLCLSLAAFLVWPFAWRAAHAGAPASLLLSRALLHAAVLASVGAVHGRAAAGALGAALGGVLFGAPACLVRSHGAKVDLSGPWDEARLALREVST